MKINRVYYGVNRETNEFGFFTTHDNEFIDKAPVSSSLSILLGINENGDYYLMDECLPNISSAMWLSDLGPMAVPTVLSISHGESYQGLSKIIHHTDLGSFSGYYVYFTYCDGETYVDLEIWSSWGGADNPEMYRCNIGNVGNYSKPWDGIPKSDFASEVQASLDKADTALQSVPAEYVTETELTNKGYSTTSYVDQKVADLVNGAPDTLNTLDELAAALKDNADIVTILENSIANKADKEHSHENYQEKGNYLTYVDKDGSKVVEPIAVNNILAVIDENSGNVAALYCDSDGGAVLANRYCVGGFDRGYGMNANNQPVWLYPETDGNIGGSEFSFEGHTHDEYVTNEELQSALADVKVDVDLSEYAKLTDIPSHDNFVTKDTLPNSIIVPENLEIIESETEAGKVYFGYYNNPTNGGSNSGFFINMDGSVVGPLPLDTNTMMEFEIVDGKVVEDDMAAILNVLFNVVADTTSAILTRVRIDDEYYDGISYITFFGRSAGSSMGHSFKFKSLGEGRTLEVSFESYGGNAASFQDTRNVSVKFTEPESIDLSEYAKLSDIPSHDNYLEVVDGVISVPAAIAVGTDENAAAMVNMGSDGTAVIANKIVGSDFAFGLMYTDYRIRLNDDNRPILY
jgi:hypothetical protein